MKPAIETLTHHFLIATPWVADHFFRQSVVYLYQHSEEGAQGFVVNKPLKMNVESILKHLQIDIEPNDSKEYPVFAGGLNSPEQGLIVYEKLSQDNKYDLLISSSKEELIEVSKNSEDFLVILGQSSWEAGQIEEEITGNSWLIAPFHRDLLFSQNHTKKWHAALASIGVDLSRFSGNIGHA